MNIKTVSSRLAAMLLFAALTACGGGGSDSVAEPDAVDTTPDVQELAQSSLPLAVAPIKNFVILQSDAGDPIGRGKSAAYTQADSYLHVYDQDGYGINVDIYGYEHWWGFFGAPQSYVQMKPGLYRANPASAAAMAWSHPESNGDCPSGIEGWFLIEKVAYSAGHLSALDATFEQHCVGVKAALRGQVHWRTGDTTKAAGPVNPPPKLWKPAPGATPATGNYFHSVSDAGDAIGDGQTATRTEPPGKLNVESAGNKISIGVEGDYNAWLYFQTMNSVTKIVPGYYAKIRTIKHENNPATGYLEIGNDALECSSVNGWVVVDKVVYSGAEVIAIDLRFEQHCNDAAPAIRGSVHWVKP